MPSTTRASNKCSLVMMKITVIRVMRLARDTWTTWRSGKTSQSLFRCKQLAKQVWSWPEEKAGEMVCMLQYWKPQAVEPGRMLMPRLRDAWPWTHYLTSLSLSYCVCKMGIQHLLLSVVMRIKWDHVTDLWLSVLFGSYQEMPPSLRKWGKLSCFSEAEEENWKVVRLALINLETDWSLRRESKHPRFTW